MRTEVIIKPMLRPVQIKLIVSTLTFTMMIMIMMMMVAMIIMRMTRCSRFYNTSYPNISGQVRLCGAKDACNHSIDFEGMRLI